jgi:tyrosyl-tRNA synthetase
MGIALIEELNERELIAQVSDMEALRQHLETGSRTLYCGFDPTADSLHIGNLVPLLTLRRFQLGGHRPILLLGGATGLIGDPSGRSDERNLNSGEVVAGWVERIRRQVEGFVDFSGGNGAVIVNNLDWTADLPVIAFLRDVGKHFSVNTMIQRESVKSRLDRDEAGISYTEFSYMLLQAMDYLELAERYDCSLQIGGSDQWGNIVSGMDLVRRKLKKEAFALTLPLVTKADGTKFGKTAAGAVWIDPDRTSPYSFYQFWLNTADADVVRFLQVFTFLPLERIAQLAEAAREAPERREAQQALAEEVTSLVHGDSSLESARRISRCLFQGDIRGLTEADLNQLQQDGIQCTVTKEERPGLLAVLADAGLAPSRSAARKLLQGGGVSVNGVVQEHPEAELDWGQALFGRYFLVRRGKKNWHLLARRKES